MKVACSAPSERNVQEMMMVMMMMMVVMWWCGGGTHITQHLLPARHPQLSTFNTIYCYFPVITSTTSITSVSAPGSTTSASSSLHLSRRISCLTSLTTVYWNQAKTMKVYDTKPKPKVSTPRCFSSQSS